MSHRFKRPAAISEQGRALQKVRRLAARIPDQETLDRVMANTEPHLRDGLLAALRRHLAFELPEEE